MEGLSPPRPLTLTTGHETTLAPQLKEGAELIFLLIRQSLATQLSARRLICYRRSLEFSPKSRVSWANPIVS